MELKINTDYIVTNDRNTRRITVLELTKTSMLYRAGNYDHRVLLSEFHKTFDIIEEIEEQEFALMHGFNTREELAAYERGRSDESDVIFKFIQDWDGNDNSQLGALINSKIQEFLI